MRIFKHPEKPLPARSVLDIGNHLFSGWVRHLVWHNAEPHLISTLAAIECEVTAAYVV
ncbi:MAG: hypothetical protein JO248_05745 [Acidimicrobiia bacterium]|nr:hypothetical protein [Acidimicrobiia bacterium]